MLEINYFEQHLHSSSDLWHSQGSNNYLIDRFTKKASPNVFDLIQSHKSDVDKCMQSIFPFIYNLVFAFVIIFVRSFFLSPWISTIKLITWLMISLKWYLHSSHLHIVYLLVMIWLFNSTWIVLSSRFEPSDVMQSQTLL